MSEQFDFKRNQERTAAAKKAAIAALDELFDAELQLWKDLGVTRDQAHLRRRIMNTDRVVRRLLEVTLLDKLELTGL